MRYILQQYVLSLSALFFTSFIFSGLSIGSGAAGYFFAAVLLMLGLMILKPVLHIVAFPLRLITLGLFPTLVTMFILFVISIVDHNFSVHAFQFPGFTLFSFFIPSFQANIFLSYVLISVTIQLIYKLFQYVFDL